MNKMQLFQKRREVTNLVRISNRKLGGLYWHSKESGEHILMKLEICKYLKKQGVQFMTEAIFADGSGRADVLVLDWGVVIEVFETESDQSLLKKRLKYPLPVIFVKAGQSFKEELIQ